MTSQVLATGVGDLKFKTVLQHGIRQASPNVLGVAVAYVSAMGFNYLHRLVQKYEVAECRLVTDIRDGITHPTALARAMTEGWDLRVVNSTEGTFHPKFYIGGASFHADHGVAETSLILLGSANLSSAALQRNGECSYLSLKPKLGRSAGKAWKQLWAFGVPLTKGGLASYEAYFAKRNQSRHPDDLLALGVTDFLIQTENGSPAKTIKPPPDEERAIPNTAATTAWAGLQSFTGDYNLQVEFPRDAGEVLNRLLGVIATGNSVTVLCDDGAKREFIFRYYEDNGMFRLNVHNSTPGAEWVREHKEGIAAVGSLADGTLRFRIILPGQEMLEVVDRSLSLGTWGRTSTRLYGWY